MAPYQVSKISNCQKLEGLATALPLTCGFEPTIFASNQCHSSPSSFQPRHHTRAHTHTHLQKELKVGRDVAEGAMGATSAFRLQRTPQQTAAKGRAGQSHTGAAAMEVDDQAGQLVSPAGHTQDALGAKRSASRGRSGVCSQALVSVRMTSAH
eukprot:1158199-Pelagomonas_calceolata.AAC.8